MCVAVLIGVGKHSVGYRTPPRAPGQTFITAGSHQQTTVRGVRSNNHICRLTKEALTFYVQVYWAIMLMQTPSLVAVKLSFLFFYRRIFSQGTSRLFRILTVALMVVVLTWGVSFFFAFLFVCPGHPSAYWHRLLDQKMHCIDTVILNNSYGISDVIIDILIFAMPVWPVLRLQMSAQRKIAVLSIFALGAL